MHKALFLLAAIAVLSSGCQARQLANMTMRQSRTLTEMQYQQVLDNLATQIEQPDAMPWFNQTGIGKTTIQNTGQATGGVTWDYLAGAKPGAFINHADKKNAGLTATEQCVGEWDTTAVLNPDKLYLMQLLYMRALGRCPDPESAARLEQFFKGNDRRLDAVRPGWYNVGTAKDCPKDALYAGHFGHTWVWVTEAGLEGLTSLTLAILDVATISTAIAFLTPEQINANAIAAQEARVKSMGEAYHRLPATQNPGDIFVRERFRRQFLLATLRLETLYSTRDDATKADLFAKGVKAIFREVNPGNYKQSLSAESVEAIEKLKLTDEQLKDLFDKLNESARHGQADALNGTNVNSLNRPPVTAPFMGPILRPREQPGFIPYGPNVVPIP